MIKIGIFGTGHLGKIHVRCIKAIEDFELMGFFDPDDDNATKVIEEFGIKRYHSTEALISDCDIIDIVTPTITHFELAKKCLIAGKDIFVEKPITHTLEEAKEITTLARALNKLIQVGHVERFNPAFLALDNIPLNPMFIEAHRLAAFNPRGTDVSVVLDLMIHDLDLILSCVHSDVEEINATGVSILSNSPDIANVRLQFKNGAVANLTASRISLKQMRKLRIFQPDAYISLDFLDKKAQIIRLFDEEPVEKTGTMMSLDTPKGKKYIEIEMPEPTEVNAIKMELELFAKSFRERSSPIVSGEDGYKALDLAHKILEAIDKHAKKVNQIDTLLQGKQIV
jgi:predicted dehydrogenase